MSGLCRHKNKCTSNKKEQDVNDSPSDDMSQPITHNEYNKIINEQIIINRSHTIPIS